MKSLIALLTVASCATSGEVDALLPYQAESSLVTKKEMRVAAAWTTAVTSTGQGSAWVEQWLGTALPFSFQYAGVDSASFLQKWLLHRDQSELSWTDPQTGLRITWRWKHFSDFPGLEWVLSFENTGGKDTPLISEVQALDLQLNHGRKGQRYIIHGANGGRSLPDDMQPFALHVPSSDTNAGEVRLGGDFPSSNRHLPFFNIETPEDRGVLVGIGWSGNWLARLQVDGTQMRARAGLKETNFILHAGESIRTPRILLLFWEGKRLHGHNMFRRLLYTHYVPKLHGEPQKPLVSVNVCFTYHGKGGFLHQATEPTVGALVDLFVKLGAELFILDAGWYDGEPWSSWMGNWTISKTKYPRGFRPISEPLNKAGVIFGLWFASEHVSDNAPILRDHPKFLRRDGNHITLRMDLPEAREWFLERVADFVSNEGVGCYRQDGAGHIGPEPEYRKGIAESQHLAGLYTKWDELVKRHPALIMEGCSGGGRRIDLETVSRFHWHQKSDRWYDSESDQTSLYGANLYLPGGTINIPTEANDDYGAWSSFAGQLSLAWHPLDPDFPIQRGQQQVELYKEIRPLLSGDFYPLTPGSLLETWIGYQFHRADSDTGFALIFRRPDTGQTIYPVSLRHSLSLRGLDPKRSYRVRFQRDGRVQTLTGEVLANGIGIVLVQPRSAEMIRYERAQ